MSKSEKTTINLIVETHETPETALTQLTELLDSSEVRFTIKDIKTKIAKATKPAIKKPKEKSEEMEELTFLIKLVAEQWFDEDKQGKKSNTAKLMWTGLDEEVLIRAIDNIDPYDFLIVIDTYPYTTKKLLQKLAEKAAEHNGSFKGARLPIAERVVKHKLCDEEILWIIAKSPYRSFKALAIPQADEKMLKSIERDLKGTKAGKHFEDEIAKRRRLLEKN